MKNFYQKLAKLLPKKLIYFATIQLGAEVTTGDYSSTEVPKLTLMEALKRFEQKNNLNH